MAAGGTTLEYTPTWVVAAVCSVIVAISFIVERIIHRAGKYLIKKNQNYLYEALLKVKEELMLLGFISLLLAVFQDRLSNVCIPKAHADKWLPCKKKYKESSSSTAHFQLTGSFFPAIISGRRLLADDSSSTTEDPAYPSCPDGQVQIISTTALHHLHIFIFALAVAHVAFCALTLLFASAKIRQWKRWEDSVLKREYNPAEVLGMTFTRVHQHDFIRTHFRGIGKNSTLMGWLRSFFKQFYGSMTKSDYTTLRLGFIMTHCRGNPKFNFHKYMMRALEADFKKVVGISWYLWLFVVVFLLLNVNGVHAYFWIAFVPFILLLAVGTKLEHVIAQLAQEVAEKHDAIEGDLVVTPSDTHFWFHRPQLILLLIHIILFQNSFEIAFFFWIWAQYGFDSCIMGELIYVIQRLVIGVFVQFVCSYSTLPLYAIVTQMGSSYKKAIFDEHIQEGLHNWQQNARRRLGLRKGTAASNGSSQGDPKLEGSSTSVRSSVQLTEVQVEKESQGNAAAAGGEIEAATVSVVSK